MNSRAPEPCDIPASDHDRHSPWAAKGLPRPAPGPGALYTYRAAQAAVDHHENGQT